MNEEDKEKIINNLNLKIGVDIECLTGAYAEENTLTHRKKEILRFLNTANEIPTELSSTIKKAELDSKRIDDLKIKSNELREKVEELLQRTEPLRLGLEQRFYAINKLEKVLTYVKSFDKIDDLSRQMKQSNDDEQLVLLYGELKEMCVKHEKGHRAHYLKECTHYWHNVLKDKISKNYEDVLKALKWPFAGGVQNSPPPKEIMAKFTNLTRYLFLIQEPEALASISITEEYGPEQNPCLPVRLLLRPLKKRFTFHFTGSRQTARIDRPEWFLTQTLTWIKDHQTFVRCQVQPVADKLELRKVKAVDEFVAGLVALAAERLHTVLAIYHTQGAKGVIVDMDAAFAHAVDETLGFNRELISITGRDVNNVLSVLTKAETFVQWLAVEKKYALSKMDEMLSSEQWCEAVASGVEAATGAMVWVPRAADWFISLLKTIEDRYAVLPQPGHRLQFLELQLELVEEWRVRLTQLLGAALDSVTVETFLSPGPLSHPMTAVINGAHYTHTVLLQWAHSLHYLQLHYYRRQFNHFTQQQHREDISDSPPKSNNGEVEDENKKTAKENPKTDGEPDTAISLKEVEDIAKKLALKEVTRRDSLVTEQLQVDKTVPEAKAESSEPLYGVDELEEGGVFAEAPALLGRLRDAGLTELTKHILLEFKAGLRDYKRQKWHSMPVTEARALNVSTALCAPLAKLCARLCTTVALLAPPLSARLRAQLADVIDKYIFEEVVLQSWFNTGGTMQFTHDVKRCLVPAFAPANKVASEINQLPKLVEACKILDMDYDDARRLRGALNNMQKDNYKRGESPLTALGICHVTPKEALLILKQRTDLSETGAPTSVMDLF